MPPQPFVDIAKIDQSKIAVNKEGIYAVNPHRYEFQLLDGIFFVDHENQVVAGYRDCRSDEFWVRGHIPGRPLFPGVLMIEASAQLVSYVEMTRYPGKGFLGFGGVSDVKFRGQVVPGDRLILVAKMVESRPRRAVGAVQGYVKYQLVFEGLITGMWL